MSRKVKERKPEHIISVIPVSVAYAPSLSFPFPLIFLGLTAYPTPTSDARVLLCS